jgi:hypothetical protein
LRDKYLKLDLATLRYEPACFAGGTLVHTKVGLKPIETIQVGDWVLSKHESGEGEREYKRVTQTFKHEDRQVIRVNFGGQQADGTDKWNFLIVTPEHPIWVQGKGWKPAEKLKYYFPFINLELLVDESPKIYGNTRLFVTDKSDIAWVPCTNVSSDLGRLGSHINVHTLETVATGVFVGIDSVANTHRVKPEHLFRTTVYNIEVEDFHTYYVGKAGVWVHNKNIRTTTAAPDGKPLSGYQLTADEAAAPFLGKGEMYAYLAKKGDLSPVGITTNVMVFIKLAVRHNPTLVINSSLERRKSWVTKTEGSPTYVAQIP